MIPTVIKTLAREVHELGGNLFLVGGSVRDISLDITPSDWDCEVFGLQQNILEKLLKHYSANLVGKDFGVYKLIHGDLQIDVSLPRTEKVIGEKHTDFEVSIDPDLPLEMAALRRDFTINSMAISLMDTMLIDPLEGLSDLHSKILRHCSEQFSEDPLRVLRGMQFCARFGLTAASETIELCSQLNNEFIPPEREWEEWKKLILMGVQPSMGLDVLKKCGWLINYPALNGMPRTDQDPVWHSEGNVWQHTTLAMDYFAKERKGEDYEDLVTGLGILLHDCGKRYTSCVGDDGRIHSYGHSDTGVAVATHFMTKLTPQKNVLEDTLALVKYHMVPMALYPKGKDSTIRRLSAKVPIGRLINVALADHFATGYFKDKPPEWEPWLRERLKVLNVNDSKPSPIVMGRHLLEIGVKPGPMMGELLKRVFEAQLDGVFVDLTFGIQFARNIAEKEGYM